MTNKVVYATMTGHSKKIARAVASAVKVEPQNIIDIKNEIECDILYIVSGIYSGEAKPELLSFVENLNDKVKQVVLITSSMKLVRQDKIRSILESKGIVILEEYCCKGGFLFFSFTHPNKKDIDDVVKFVKTISLHLN